MPKRRINPPKRKRWSHKTQIVDLDQDLTENQRRIIQEENLHQAQELQGEETMLPPAGAGSFYIDQEPLVIESSLETPLSYAGRKRQRGSTGQSPEPPSHIARTADYSCPIEIEEDEPSQQFYSQTDPRFLDATLSTQPLTPRTRQMDMPDIPAVELNPTQPSTKGRSQYEHYLEHLDQQELSPQVMRAARNAQNVMNRRRQSPHYQIAVRGSTGTRHKALMMTLKKRTAAWKRIMYLENVIRQLGYGVPGTQIGTAYPRTDLSRNQVRSANDLAMMLIRQSTSRRPR